MCGWWQATVSCDSHLPRADRVALAGAAGQSRAPLLGCDAGTLARPRWAQSQTTGCDLRRRAAPSTPAAARLSCVCAVQHSSQNIQCIPGTHCFPLPARIRYVQQLASIPQPWYSVRNPPAVLLLTRARSTPSAFTHVFHLVCLPYLSARGLRTVEGPRLLPQPATNSVFSFCFSSHVAGLTRPTSHVALPPIVTCRGRFRVLESMRTASCMPEARSAIGGLSSKLTAT